MSNARFQPPGLALELPPQRGEHAWLGQIVAIAPGRSRPLAFADLPALARHIHRERGGRGLQLKPSVASYDRSDTFKAITVYFLPEGDAGAPDYAFTVAIQGRPREALEAALAAANPDIPEAA